MRNQPSIAVLPAKLFGNWEENGFLAQALPDEILTSLARVRSFLVLARGSTAELRSFEHSPSEIGTATGATYSVATEAVLDGPNIEISCELSDCRNDNCLWRERVRIKFSEIHELREDIVDRISKSIDQAVSQNELRLARMQAPGSLSAWQNYFVGNSLAERYVLEDTIRAKDHFQRAVELDPSFARAHAGLGLTHHSLYYRNWIYQTGEQAKLGMEAATRGYELDRSDPLCTLALSRQYFAQRQNDVAVPLLKRVVEMSPSSYFAQSDIARILAQTGDPNDADAHLKMVETLYPEYSSGVYAQVTRGLIALSRKDVDGAIQVAGTIEDLGDLTAYSTLLLLTTYHLAGEQALAAQTAGIIREKFKDIAGYKMIAANMGFHDGLAEVIEDAYAAHGLN